MKDKCITRSIVVCFGITYAGLLMFLEKQINELEIRNHLICR